jgi:phage terminase large subunit GpA-like protein
MVDEADAIEASVEGDPITLAERRTLSANRKIIAGGTPLEEGTSPITRLYQQSDQRVFEVPCPACGAFSEIRWADRMAARQARASALALSKLQGIGRRKNTSRSSELARGARNGPKKRIGEQPRERAVPHSWGAMAEDADGGAQASSVLSPARVKNIGGEICL